MILKMLDDRIRISQFKIDSVVLSNAIDNIGIAKI